jgi:hypothetical protein
MAQILRCVRHVLTAPAVDKSRRADFLRMVSPEGATQLAQLRDKFANDPVADHVLSSETNRCIISVAAAAREMITEVQPNPVFTWPPLHTDYGRKLEDLYQKYGGSSPLKDYKADPDWSVVEQRGTQLWSAACHFMAPLAADAIVYLGLHGPPHMPALGYMAAADNPEVAKQFLEKPVNYGDVFDLMIERGTVVDVAFHPLSH